MPDRLAQSIAANDLALEVLAGIIARHAHRLPREDRNRIVEQLVELGFDDSDDPEGSLMTIEGAP